MAGIKNKQTIFNEYIQKNQFPHPIKIRGKHEMVITLEQFFELKDKLKTIKHSK